jgi:hypothetical protein
LRGMQREEECTGPAYTAPRIARPPRGHNLGTTHGTKSKKSCGKTHANRHILPQQSAASPAKGPGRNHAGPVAAKPLPLGSVGLRHCGHWTLDCRFETLADSCSLSAERFSPSRTHNALRFGCGSRDTGFSRWVQLVVSLIPGPEDGRQKSTLLTNWRSEIAASGPSNGARPAQRDARRGYLAPRGNFRPCNGGQRRAESPRSPCMRSGERWTGKPPVSLVPPPPGK